MGFSQMMELLQIKEKGRIVFCNAGEFYVAIGKDAVLLSELLGLKVSCLKAEVCKVGFPIKSLEKYANLVMQKRYGYIVYYFNKEKASLEIVESYIGEKTNNIVVKNINCYKCRNKVKYYRRTDEYIEAVAKLYEEDIEKDKLEKSKKEETRKWFINKKKKTD